MAAGANSRSHRCVALLCLGLLGVSNGREAAKACPPKARAMATMAFTNHTSSPILVYVDGEYVGRCEAMGGCKAEVDADGEVVVVGRCICDTWGAYRLTVARGSTATLTFDDAGRR